MKPMPEYDSVYRYPVNENAPLVDIDDMANAMIPLVVCLDGMMVSFVWSDDTPAWHHYRDVPPSQAMERIEQLAHIIATHYPDTTS